MSDKTLVQKLAEVMAEVGYVQKDATNDFHKYRYASAEAVLKKVNSALSERGIALSSAAELAHYDVGHAIVKLSLTFHDGTDILTVEGLGEGSDKGDKATMKASTAALKYAMANAFLISWGDDPEADAKTDETVARETRERGKQAVKNNPSEALLDQIELPQEYPDFNALVSDHSGKKGINELRNVGVVARSKGWTQNELLVWIADHGIDLSDSGLQYSDFAKLNQRMRVA